MEGRERSSAEVLGSKRKGVANVGAARSGARAGAGTVAVGALGERFGDDLVSGRRLRHHLRCGGAGGLRAWGLPLTLAGAWDEGGNN